MIEDITSSIEETILTLNKLREDPDTIEIIKRIVSEIIRAFGNQKKILIAGNGGSAADAQHIAGEFVSRFKFDRPALPAIALTTDTSILTAIGNDYGYDFIFSRQLEATGSPGDVFLAYSTSGKSRNILQALKKSRSMNMVTVGMTGNLDSEMERFCDYAIKIPSGSTPRIQEGHLVLGHIICELVEREIFRGK